MTAGSSGDPDSTALTADAPNKMLRFSLFKMTLNYYFLQEMMTVL